MSDFAAIKDPAFPDCVYYYPSESMEVWKPLLISVKLQYHMPCRQKEGQLPEQAWAWRNSLGSAFHPLENCLVVPRHMKGRKARKGRRNPGMPVKPEAGPPCLCSRPDLMPHWYDPEQEPQTSEVNLPPLEISESGPSKNLDLVLISASPTNCGEGAVLYAICHRPALS